MVFQQVVPAHCREWQHDAARPHAHVGRVYARPDGVQAPFQTIRTADYQYDI